MLNRITLGVVVWLGSSVSVIGEDSLSRGELELKYEPKVCVMAPCPQFVVVQMNGRSVKDLGADLVNVDPTASAMTSFRKIKVKGSWRVVSENHLDVNVDEWSVTVKQTINRPDSKMKAPN